MERQEVEFIEYMALSITAGFAARDQVLQKTRAELAVFAAQTFLAVSDELLPAKRHRGQDQSDAQSVADETMAVSLLLRIASELVAASADLFASGRHYAAAALIRQMVEVEYLAWAFEERDGDAERWLRSTREEREEFFAPRKLRKASEGKFRTKDYGYHCEMGGHPVPGAGMLFSGDVVMAQIMLVDLLGHAGRIWDHLVRWAADNPKADAISARREAMLERFMAWKRQDRLSALPPPP
jgi:hypothetical protein